MLKGFRWIGITIFSGTCFANALLSQEQPYHSPPRGRNTVDSPVTFTGKRISMKFQHIEKRALLQILAEFKGINMVVSEKVQGNMTLNLNNIPWDQALDIILSTQGLDKRQVGKVMFIDTRDNLNKMEEHALKSQRISEKLEPISSKFFQVNYAKVSDIAALVQDKQNSLLSDRGKITVDKRTNRIWMQDSKAKLEALAAFIRNVDVPVKQVLIEARIVDVTKEFSQDLGIRWGVSKPSHLSGTIAGAEALTKGVADLPLASRLNLDLAASPASFKSPASVGVALAKLGDGILLDLELSALESEGRAELISSPRLITTNQQAAVIESGAEIPYQESTTNGATAVSFKKAVLSLRVVPQITPDGKIMMELQINQDTPSAEKYNGVPAILTKEIHTHVLVNNGQTVVLGGIYKQDKNQALNRVPFLGGLPMVGGLFRNKQMRLNNEELLIFIRPKIIAGIN